MPDSERPIPQPTPFDELPPPELPPEFKPPPPACLRATVVMAAGQEELALVYKRTYKFEHGRETVAAEEQPPLVADFVPHEAIEPDHPVSFKDMPEVVGYKTGTDLVIRGCARPAKPLTQTEVGVDLNGKPVHAAAVFGKRCCEYVNGTLVFSPPAPFEEMPVL